MSEPTADNKPSILEQTFSPEVQKVFPYPYVEKVPGEITPLERYVNAISKGFWAWDAWTHAKSHDLNEDLPKILLLNQKINDISRFTREKPISDINFNPEKIAAEIDKTAQELLDKLGEEWPPDDHSYTRDDETGARLRLAILTFGRLSHDTASGLTVVSGTYELQKRAKQRGVINERTEKYPTNIESGFETMRSAFKNGREALLDEYHQQPIELSYLYQLTSKKIDEYFLDSKSRVKARVGQLEGDPRWKVTYSSDQLGLLLTNIARNTLEEYKKIEGLNEEDEFLDISSKLVIDKDGKPTHIRIIFDDHGRGFPQEILDNQFKDQVTTKETGTGTGLNYHQETLNSKYGGARLIAENRPEVGGRLILELPITNTEPQTT